MPGYGWTLKKLRIWVEEKMGHKVSRTTLRTLLKQAGLSWKKCKKLLTKADPVKRAQFVEQFQTLFAQMCQEEVRVIYIDQAHLHQDLDLGYTWSPLAKPAWQASTSPPLSARINWYGAYDFSEGQCFIWAKGACNSDQTVQFLDQVFEWLNEKERQIIIIWDGAPWHRSKKVHRTAKIKRPLDLGACPVLFQDTDDLLFGKAFALHLGTAFVQNNTVIPQCRWIG